ncbi:MAG: hypothetical protein ACJAVV_001042 [Alphaproteobacteria bacterium]|jgi:hypothetical protein
MQQPQDLLPADKSDYSTLMLSVYDDTKERLIERHSRSGGS